MTTEICQLSESNEYNKDQCDNKLDQLEQKIALDFPFEKNDNWTYSIIKDNIKLDIDISPDNLVEANKEILQLLTFFKQNANSSSHFDTDWYDDSIDMEQGIIDQEYLSNELFQKLFWWEENKQKLINFLHLILWVSETDWDFNYNKSNAAPDYIDLVDMQKNEKLISSIQDKYSSFEQSFKWKTIQEIKKSFWEVNRENSLLLLMYLANNPVMVWSGLLWVNSVQSITYNNMVYSSLQWSNSWVNLRTNYEWWAFVELQQYWSIRWKIQLVDYNDQIILNRLLWKTSKNDYSIPASTTRYMWTKK